MCPLCRGGLWLHFNPGYLCRFLGEAVPTAALSALPSIGPLVPDPLRMEFRKASPLDAVHRCRLPMLFIHGDKDSVVPVEMVHRLYEAKIGDKELWILSGVDHGAAYLHDPQIYAQRVRTFVEHWFECPAILEQ